MKNIILVVAFAFLLPFTAWAESVSWSTTYNGTLTFEMKLADEYQAQNAFLSFLSSVTRVSLTDLPFLDRPNITVREHAQVTNLDTGAPVACGSSVPQGTHLRFSFVPHVPEDVFWFGTGVDQDSPYGEWVNNAGAVDVCSMSKNLIYTTYGKNGTWHSYADFTVNPPVESMSGLEGLGCTATSEGADCITPTGGVYSAAFNYGETYGKFYGCVNGTSSFLTKVLKILSGRNYTPYTVQIPAQQISCPITVIGSAIPPNAPTVTDVGACTQEIAHSYKIVATDSDTAAQLHYGIDWNNDAVVDEWVPATGYVAQGTQQTISHIWMTSGSHTFKVIAVDSQGNHSTWTSHTVSCAITPSEPVVLITATPVEWGAVSTLQWSSTGASSCTGTGFSTGGSTSGTITTGPVTQTTTYSIMCDAATDFTTITINVCPSGYTGTPPTCTLSSTQCPPGYTGTPPNCAAVSSCPLGYTGTPPNCICSPSPICSGTNLVNSCTGAVIQACSYSCSNNACVVLAPQVVSWSVAPKLVSKGNTTNVSWEVKHVSSCTVTGTNGDSWTGLKGTKLSGPISSQTIFSLICQPLSGSAAGAVTRSTTVNITPTFIER